MWFDDDLAVRKRLLRRRNVSRRRPVLVLNAHLRQRRRAWVSRGALLAGFLAMVAIAGAAGWLLLREVRRVFFVGNDEYILTNLVIRCESADLRQYVREQMAPPVGTNLFRINIAAIQAKAGKTANVKSAVVRRYLPGTLEIALSERIPIARLGNSLDKRRYMVVDEEGVVFLARSRSLADSLPTLVGYGEGYCNPGVKLSGAVENALTVLDKCRTARAGRLLKIAVIDVRDQYVKAQLADGPVVSLAWKRGSAEQALSDLENRLDYLCGILWHRKKQGKPVWSVDLTFDNYKEYTPITPL